MSAIIPLCHLLGIGCGKLEKQEQMLLEGLLFTCIYRQLQEECHSQHKAYFCLIKLNKEQQEMMIKNEFIRYIIRKLLSEEEYTLEGIAQYTHTDADVVMDIYRGHYLYPSAEFLYRLIELHFMERKDLHRNAIKKLEPLLLPSTRTVQKSEEEHIRE